MLEHGPINSGNETKAIHGEQNMESGRMSLVTLEDLMKREIKVEWLIDGFIAKGCLAFLHGVTGVKRSFLLQEMALALATGEGFLGYAIEKPVKVLLHQQELTHAQVKERAYKMLLKYGSVDVSKTK